MEAFNIINILQQYCLDNNIHFISGQDDYINAIADRTKYEAGDLIMICFFSATPTITGGRIVANKYSGEIGLGRKREDNTVSSLDETFQQKHDNRLQELATSLSNIVGQIACENEFDITQFNIKLEINQFDLNADFVTGTIILNDE